jgi:L,D-transpeptidase YcbB
MMLPLRHRSLRVFYLLNAAALGLFLATADTAQAQVSPFSQSVAIAAAEDEDMAAIYAARNYAPIWTTAQAEPLRAALLTVLAGAGDHGLPVSEYDPAALTLALQNARTEGDRGRAEVAMTAALVDYMRDMRLGVVVPRSVDATIVIERPEFDASSMVAAFLAAPSPERFLRDLAPQTPEYALLMRERLRL